MVAYFSLSAAKVDSPSTHAKCGLTPRSSGAPTAGHQGPGRGTVYIFSAQALASCRRRPLSSNVRRQPIPAEQTAVHQQLLWLRHASEAPAQHHTARLQRASPQVVLLSVAFKHRRLLPVAPQQRLVVASRAALRNHPRRWQVLRTPLSRGFVHRAPPNPSFKRSANGRPPGPRGRLGYHRPRGPGVLPLSPA